MGNGKNQAEGLGHRQKLLVEDNVDDELLILRALKMNRVGNGFFVARDGAEALDWLFAAGPYAQRDASVLPAMVLLDLKLPKIDSLEVLQRIRADARTALLPVVILTSSDMEEDVARSYKFGANSFVRKPVGFEGFIKAIHELGLYWLIINEPPPQGDAK